MTLIEKYTYSVFTRKTKHIKAVKTNTGYMVQECIISPNRQHTEWLILDEIIDSEPHIESILDPYIEDKFIANDLISLTVIKLRAYSIYGQQSMAFSHKQKLRA